MNGYLRRSYPNRLRIISGHGFKCPSHALNGCTVFFHIRGHLHTYLWIIDQLCRPLNDHHILAPLCLIEGHSDAWVFAYIPQLLFFGLTENQQHLPLPHKPNRDGIWASIASHSRQPRNTVRLQTLLGVFSRLCRNIKHTKSFPITGFPGFSPITSLPYNIDARREGRERARSVRMDGSGSESAQYVWSSVRE